MSVSRPERHNLRAVETTTVIRSTVSEGAGVEGDPRRLVTYWHEPNRVLIARRDPFEESRSPASSTEDD